MEVGDPVYSSFPKNGQQLNHHHTGRCVDNPEKLPQNHQILCHKQVHLQLILAIHELEEEEAPLFGNESPLSFLFGLSKTPRDSTDTGGDDDTFIYAHR